jgi:hypothetical protein
MDSACCSGWHSCIVWIWVLVFLTVFHDLPQSLQVNAGIIYQCIYTSSVTFHKNTKYGDVDNMGRMYTLWLGWRRNECRWWRLSIEVLCLPSNLPILPFTPLLRAAAHQLRQDKHQDMRQKTQCCFIRDSDSSPHTEVACVCVLSHLL